MSKCNCYNKAYLPIVLLLEESSDRMWYKSPDFDKHQQMIHDMVIDINTKWKCINNC